MLGKLLKHEWRSSAKLLGIINAAILLLALMGKMTISIPFIREELTFIWGLTIFAYVLALVFIPMITMFYLISRFYKNLFSHEGYLSFTLPVKARDHIICKTIYFFIWLAITTLVSIGSVLILAIGEGVIGQFPEMLHEVNRSIQMSLGINPLVFWICLLLFCIVNVLFFILSIYAAMAIGQITNRHRIVMSILIYMGVSFLINIILVLSMAALDHLVPPAYYADQGSILAIMFFTMMVLEAIGITIFFFITQFFMEKKLNLE